MENKPKPIGSIQDKKKSKRFCRSINNEEMCWFDEKIIIQLEQDFVESKRKASLLNDPPAGTSR